jgi:transposase-like protein
MSQNHSSRVIHRYSEDFKLSVLKDYYESGSSYRAIKKKYQLSDGCVQRWLKERPLSEISVSLPPETIKRLESMAKKASETPVPGSIEARIAELESENQRLKAALEYSELRVEAFSRAIKYYDEQEGVDILKKAGTRQR